MLKYFNAKFFTWETKLMLYETLIKPCKCMGARFGCWWNLILNYFIFFKEVFLGKFTERLNKMENGDRDITKKSITVIKDHT